MTCSLSSVFIPQYVLAMVGDQHAAVIV